MKTKANRDIWSVMKIVILVFVALAILYPLSTIVIRSVTTEAGEVTGKNFLKFFTKPYYLD
ncbi:MAG TPA: iron ABC transporter permease, partial [Clostridia bacterium]|nr:iron ABC transporter permease [Clostridia bacterium]